MKTLGIILFIIMMLCLVTYVIFFDKKLIKDDSERYETYIKSKKFEYIINHPEEFFKMSSKEYSDFMK